MARRQGGLPSRKENAMNKAKKLTCGIVAAILLSWATTATVPVAAQEKKLGADEAKQIGVETYIYGYPLVTVEMTRRVMTNVPTVGRSRGPMGQLVDVRQYPTAADRDVTAPNADTLYSVAWLDVGKEPYILSIPDEKDRYFLMPMLSGWTDVFAVPGTRTTGTDAQKYAITGAGWQG